MEQKSCTLSTAPLHMDASSPMKNISQSQIREQSCRHEIRKRLSINHQWGEQVGVAGIRRAGASHVV